MITTPGAPPPDTITPRSPPEQPAEPAPSENPASQAPEIVPNLPDVDQPDVSPGECPPPN